MRGTNAVSKRSSSNVSAVATARGPRSSWLYKQAVSQYLLIVGMVKPSSRGTPSSGAKRCLWVATSA